MRVHQFKPLVLWCPDAKKALAFPTNSFPFSSSRTRRRNTVISASISRGSGPPALTAWRRSRSSLTHQPTTDSPSPQSRATNAIVDPVSNTKVTTSRRYTCVKQRREPITGTSLSAGTRSVNNTRQSPQVRFGTSRRLAEHGHAAPPAGGPISLRHDDDHRRHGGRLRGRRYAQRLHGGSGERAHRRGHQLPHVSGVSAGASYLCNFVSRDAASAHATFVDLVDDPEFGGVSHFRRGQGYFNAEYIYERICYPDGAMPFDLGAFLRNPACTNVAVFNVSRGRCGGSPRKRSPP